ncbi:MAG: PrsW family glutamic-type intramembrane protease [Candidatus Pacebacteria bacterium]|nr:PrsW family glutamic-type intramembrane protease [Candidatus Paceibacterota bacterium]
MAIVEEVVKFLMIYFTLHRSKYLDEAIDPMIYMVVCAIGFSSIENYFSIFDQLHTFVVPFQTLTARFLGANLLHIICSGVIGFF